ncbi:MAG: zinc-binding dehydrogenase [Candidatus Kerfeldbacteria bacterium]|nr:zinc-binding dehydrogenase [Candidatus Kerfeldbacteria bacterium]
MRALIKKKPSNPPAWYQGLELVDKPEPKVTVERPVKVKVMYAGICGTDVGIYQGKDSLANSMARLSTPEVIIGHEFCGQIVELHNSAREFMAGLLLRHRPLSSAVAEYLAGKKLAEIMNDPGLINFLTQNFYVTAEMHITCGQCLQCRIGHQHVCKHTIGKGLHEDGTFAEYVTLPVNRLVLLEIGEVEPEIIAFMDALGNAVHTAQTVDLVGKTALITGAGIQGLMSCAVARQMGATKIIVTDYSVYSVAGAIDKLAVARKLGADFTFDVRQPAEAQALVDTIEKETGQTGVDVVFEMSGNYAAFEQAFANIRLGGTMLLLGLPAGKLEVDFSKEVVFKGLTIQGIYGRRVFDTWDLMRYLLANGLAQTIKESGVITHKFALPDYEQGFQALLNGQAIKVLLKP